MVSREKFIKNITPNFRLNLPSVNQSFIPQSNEKTVVEKLENCVFSDPVSVLQEYLVHNNLDPPSYSSHIADRIYSIT